MNAFEITLLRKVEDGWPVVVEQTAGDASLPIRGEGTLDIDPAALPALEEDPHAYGEALGRALFRDTVRDAFAGARAGEANDLRVLLNVEAPDLKTLRWERLCAPLQGDWEFLALDQSVPFSLYLPSVTDQRFPPIGRRDLRALVVVASPEGLDEYGLAPFDAAATIESVRAALGDIPTAVLATGEGFAGPPTLDALCERITAEPDTLLHIVCHGQVLQDGPHAGETVLYLAGPDGRAAHVGATELIERLGTLGGARGLPHLAFLCACESASSSAEAEGALGGLAQRLVRELGMPAVVAMSDTVTVETAQAVASVFYRRLREHGEVDRALVEAGAGLGDRPDATVPALYSRLGGRPLFSDSLDRPLTAAEIGDGLERLAALVADRAPVLGPQLATLTAELRDSLAADPAALSADERTGDATALAAVDRLCLEASDLSFGALALGQAPPPADTRQPFRGLSAFGPADHDFFFGREALIARLRERLEEHPFLAVLGPSGSGKSSVVLGGLVPTVGGEFAVLTPGAEPAAQLAVALAGKGLGALVVVDQFEELFTQGADDAARRAFIEALLALVPEHRVVITMRADFWGDCAPYPKLKAAMQAHQELIAPMDASELRRAMELQAAAVGLRFEADLSATLLAEVAGEPGAMPLLQQALLELWKRRHGRWLLAAEYRAIGGVRQAIAHTADELYEGLPEADRARVQDIFVRLTRLDDADVAAGAHRDTRRRVGASELVPAGADPGPIRTLLARLADARLVVTGVNAVTGQDDVEVVHEALIRYWPRLREWLDEGRANLRQRDAVRAAAIEWQAAGRSDALLVHRAGRLEDAVQLSRQPRYVLNALEQAYLDAAVAFQAQEQQRELEQVKALAEEQRQRAEAEARARTVAERAGTRQRYLSIGLAVLMLGAIGTAGFAFVQQQAANQQRELAELATRSAEDERLKAQDAAAVADDERGKAEAAAAVADGERRNAEAAAVVALSGRLAAEAVSHVTTRPDLAQLLAVESFRKSDTFESQSSLLATTQCCPEALLAFLSGHTDTAWDVSFSPDGKLLASTGNDGTVKIWDVATRKVLRSIGNANATATLYTLAFSPTDPVLAVGSSISGVLFYDTRTWLPLGGIPRGHKIGVFSLKYSLDGATLVSGGLDGEVLVWDVRNMSQVTTRVFFVEPETTKPVWVFDVAISPDGRTIASVGDDKKLRLWDLGLPGPTPTQVASFSNQMLSAEFPDNQRSVLVTSDTRGMVVVWDLGEWQRSRGAPAPSRALDPTLGAGDRMFGLAQVPGTDLSIVTAQNLGTLRRDRIVFNVNGTVARLEPESLNLGGNAIGFFRIDVSPDGTLIAAAGRDGLISLWDSRESVNVNRHAAALSSQRILPDGHTVISVDARGNLGRWDYRDPIARSSRPLAIEPSIETNRTFKSSISFDGTRVATGDDLGRLMLLDTQTGRRLAETIEHPPQGTAPFAPKRIRALAFSPDGRQLATGDNLGRVVLWDVSRDELTPVAASSADPANGIRTLAFSPDGLTLVGGGCGVVLAQVRPDCEQGIVYVWNAQSLQHQYSLTAKSGFVVSAAFHPSRPELAVGTLDGTVTIWDLRARKPLRSVKLGILDVDAMAYRSDGTRLAIGTNGLDARTSIQVQDVYVFEADTLRIVGQRFKDHDRAVVSLDFAPDGSVLLSGSLDRTIVIHDMAPASWLARACRIANRNLTPDERTQFVGDPSSSQTMCP